MNFGQETKRNETNLFTTTFSALLCGGEGDRGKCRSQVDGFLIFSFSLLLSECDENDDGDGDGRTEEGASAAPPVVRVMAPGRTVTQGGKFFSLHASIDAIV